MENGDGRDGAGCGSAKRDVLRIEISQRRLDDTRATHRLEEVGNQRLAVEHTLQSRIQVTSVSKVAETRKLILQCAAVMRVRRRLFRMSCGAVQAQPTTRVATRCLAMLRAVAMSVLSEEWVK